MNEGLALLALVLLLAGNGFFVASEFAMVSARRDHLEPLAADGNRRARWSLHTMENVSAALAATQLGVTACSLLIGAVGEPAVAHLIEAPMHALHAPEGLVEPVALAISLLAVTFLHMLLGEMVPKSVAIARPAQAALTLGPPLRVFSLVLAPAIWVMNATANGVVRHVLRAEPRNEVASTFTVDQLRGLVDTSTERGLLDADETTLVSGALAFDTVRAADVMTPMSDVEVLDSRCTVGELQARCAESGFSRFPLRFGSADEGGELIGYVHVKDTLTDDPSEQIPGARVRRLGSVAADDPLDDVLERMQGARAHLALVEGDLTGQGGRGEADSDGPAGLVSLEDVLERLVGEVQDAADTL